MPRISAFSQLPIQKCRTLVKKPRVSSDCKRYILFKTQTQTGEYEIVTLPPFSLYIASSPLNVLAKRDNLTGSVLLRSALIELGDGKSSSEKRLGLRFLASSIGSSSSCSSGSLSAKEGEVRVLKLVLCLSMLFIGYYRRKTLHVRLVPECMLPDLSVLQHALVRDVDCAAGRRS